MYMAPKLNAFLSSKGKVSYVKELTTFYLNKREDLKISSPNENSNIQVLPLTDDHAKIVEENWDFKDNGSNHWIKRHIGLGLAFGTFVDGELASWTCTLQ